MAENIIIDAPDTNGGTLVDSHGLRYSGEAEFTDVGVLFTGVPELPGCVPGPPTTTFFPYHAVRCFEFA